MMPRRPSDSAKEALAHAPVGLIPEVRSIAVLRANGIGDLVFILPALAALRAAYPAACVTLLGQPWHVTFLQGRGDLVDRAIAVPICRGVREGPEEDAEALRLFFARMVEERFDLALQMHGGGRFSNPFVRRLGAALTAGLRTPDATPLDRNVPYVYFMPEVLRYLEVAAVVGAPVQQLEPQLQVTREDLLESEQVVPRSRQPLVVLHAGATDPRRCWPPEHFARVADALAAQGAQVVVVGTGQERERVTRLLTAMRARAQDVIDRLSLSGLAGLLSRAAVVVSNDSGPLHLAAAVGSRTVGIYWCGNFINAGPFTRTRHRPAICWRLECPICGVNCLSGRCDHDESFVADVRVEEVLSNASALLRDAALHEGQAADEVPPTLQASA